MAPKPKTLREFITAHFLAILETQPELRNQPYLCVKDASGKYFTYGEMTTIYEDHPDVVRELEHGLIGAVIDFAPRLYACKLIEQRWFVKEEDAEVFWEVIDELIEWTGRYTLLNLQAIAEGLIVRE